MGGFAAMRINSSADRNSVTYMRTQAVRRLVLINLVAIFLFLGAPSPKASADSQLITGVKHVLLFDGMGIQLLETQGLTYVRLKGPANSGLERLGMSITVHLTVNDARVSREHRLDRVSVPPTHQVAEDAVGDQCLVWGGPGDTGGNMWFRRLNVIVELDWKGPWAELLAIAQAIDNALQNDREIAPMGTFDPLPAIVDVGLPATVAVPAMIRLRPDGQPSLLQERPLAYLRIQPVFQGLGPAEKIRLLVTVEDFGRNEVGLDGRSLKLLNAPIEGNRYKVVEASAQNDGRFILRLGVPEQPTTRKVTLIAASEDNVIVTKEADITFTPQP
jgi:hypothetical protein